MHKRVVAPSAGGYEHDAASEPSRSLPQNSEQAPVTDIRTASQTSSGQTNHSATVFQCSGFGDCQMVFTRSEHLARHVRKHTGERPFQCHCTKSFSRLDNLRQHCQTVHSDTPDRNEEVLRRLSVLHSNLAASAAKNQRSAAKLLPTEIQPGPDSDASHDTTHSRWKAPLLLPTSVAVSSLLSVNEPTSTSVGSTSGSTVSENRYASPSNSSAKRVHTDSAPPITHGGPSVSSPPSSNWPHHYSSQPPEVRSTSHLPPLSDLFGKAQPANKDPEHRATSRSWPVNFIDPSMRSVIGERNRASYSAPLHHTNGSSDSSHSVYYAGPSFRPTHSNNASPSRYTPTIQFDLRWTNYAKHHSAGPATPVSYEPSKSTLLPPAQQGRINSLHEAKHSFSGNKSLPPLDQSSPPSTLSAMTPTHESHTPRPLKKSRSILFPGNALNSTPSSSRRLSAHQLYADQTEDHRGQLFRRSSLSVPPQYLKSGGVELPNEYTLAHGTTETSGAYLDAEARKTKWESSPHRRREAINCRQADMRSFSLSLPDKVPHSLQHYDMSRKRSIEEDAR